MLSEQEKSEIRASYKNAIDPRQHVKILMQLYLVSHEEILDVLGPLLVVVFHFPQLAHKPGQLLYRLHAGCGPAIPCNGLQFLHNVLVLTPEPAAVTQLCGQLRTLIPRKIFDFQLMQQILLQGVLLFHQLKIRIVYFLGVVQKFCGAGQNFRRLFFMLFRCFHLLMVCPTP